MHPAPRSWRNELQPNIVRLLAYLGAIALLSMAGAHFSRSPKVMGAITPVHQGWIDIERPFAAFALSIPEAAECRRAIRSDGTQQATGVWTFLLWVSRTVPRRSCVSKSIAPVTRLARSPIR